MSLFKCPFCKGEFTKEQIEKNASFEKSKDYETIHGFNQNTIVVKGSCPNHKCGFKLEDAVDVSPSYNEGDPLGVAKSYIVHIWLDRVESSPKKDHCPVCKLKEHYIREEFVYPMKRRFSKEEEVPVIMHCTSDMSCPLGYEFKSKLSGKELFEEARKIWDKMYE